MTVCETGSAQRGVIPPRPVRLSGSGLANSDASDASSPRRARRGGVSWWRSSSGRGCGHREYVRLDKAMFTFIAGLLAVMAFLWVAIYLAVGLPKSAAIPFAYQVAVVASLVGFARTKHFHAIRTFQLGLMLVLPFALQWSLGGFANSSAVAAWAGITPVLAYLFGVRSGLWRGGFVLLLTGSAAMETTLAPHAPHIGTSLRAAMWVLNLAGPSIAAFLALAYFTSERDRSPPMLAEKHHLL